MMHPFQTQLSNQPALLSDFLYVIGFNPISYLPQPGTFQTPKNEEKRKPHFSQKKFIPMNHPSKNVFEKLKSGYSVII